MQPVGEPLDVGRGLADAGAARALLDHRADRHRRAERERLAQPTSPSSVVTRTSTCFPSPAVHGEGGSVGFQGIPSGTASTATIFTGEPR